VINSGAILAVTCTIVSFVYVSLDNRKEDSNSRNALRDVSRDDPRDALRHPPHDASDDTLDITSDSLDNNLGNTLDGMLVNAVNSFPNKSTRPPYVNNIPQLALHTPALRAESVKSIEPRFIKKQSNIRPKSAPESDESESSEEDKSTEDDDSDFQDEQPLSMLKAMHVDKNGNLVESEYPSKKQVYNKQQESNKQRGNSKKRE
jgi:hypothetical protein